MKTGIDSYCYHRYFGEIYPDQEDPGVRWTFQDFVNCAAELDVRLSLRTDAVSLPEKAAIEEAELFDVFLCPPALDWAQLDPWFQACRGAEMPERFFDYIREREWV